MTMLKELIKKREEITEVINIAFAESVKELKE
jgi:hypothetical protein